MISKLLGEADEPKILIARPAGARPEPHSVITAKPVVVTKPVQVAGKVHYVDFSCNFQLFELKNFRPPPSRLRRLGTDVISLE